jgi:hypothetical protein
MDLQLIKGTFQKNEAWDLIQKMIGLKIQYHEEKITSTMNEEDIKMRESRIKQLQKELTTFKKHLDSIEGPISISSNVEVV